jgi:NAD(P)-dependent dehydrogenase (short-subunit alcohol dehydrogenase family)
MAIEPVQVALEGQVALVTGGGRGLGRAIAEALAAAGAAVAVLARSADELAGTVAHIEAHEGKAIPVPVDVTDRAAVEHTVATVENTLGPIDLLVNNAGIAEPIGAFWELDPDDWWRILEVNLRGPALCARAVLPGMVARGSGRIINVTSGAGAAPISGATAYCSSKAALIRLTDTLGVETERHGIRVFALNPGVVRTRMTESLMDGPVSSAWLPWIKPVFEEARDTPIERTAQLVVFLASGRGDALSGRVVSARDEPEALARDAESIRSEDRRATSACCTPWHADLAHANRKLERFGVEHVASGVADERMTPPPSTTSVCPVMNR